MYLSIIIPVYNVNKYICECIDSVINIEEIEIVVIDDGSIEDTTWINEKYYRYSNFKFYRKENGGLSSARNYGLKKATSEYVLFLDGDDFIDSKELEKIIQEINKTKKNAYFFNFRYFYEDTGKIEDEKKYSFSVDEYISLENNSFINNPFIMVAWRYILKREILLNNNLFFREGIYHEDEEWTPRMLYTFNKIYNLKSYLYVYRQREGSITSNYKYNHINDLFIIIKSLSEYKKTIKEKKIIEFFNRKINELYRAAILRSMYIKMDREQRKKLIKNLKSIKKYIISGNNLKNIAVKYIPYKILKFILEKIINN